MGTKADKNIIAVIIFCQFIASLSALGMPPFFALLIQKSFGVSPSRSGFSWAGLLYVTPTLFAGIASPVWGYLADRFGKKPLLLRAQLGLALSFLLAGFSKSPTLFFVALLLQGILGGTFAASRSYLALFLSKAKLAHALTLMETAPRAALVLSPMLVGILLELKSPVEIYRYLAILPLLAFLLVIPLPSKGRPLPSQSGNSEKDQTQTQKSEDNIIPHPTDLQITPYLVIFLQFVFGFTAVLTAPFFISFVHSKYNIESSALVGLIFGLPHFVYLLAAPSLSRFLGKNHFSITLVLAFFIHSITFIGQSYSNNLTVFILWRLTMGFSMTLSFIALHGMISSFTTVQKAGAVFGWIDSSVRFSAVAGGLLAGFGAQRLGQSALFLISSSLLMMTSFYLCLRIKLSLQQELPGDLCH